MALPSWLNVSCYAVVMLPYNKRLQPHLLYAGGQIILGVCLLACLIVVPRYLFSFDQGGVSNYGTESQTKWLFTAGFSAATIGTLSAAIALPRSSTRRLQLRLILIMLAVLYLFVMMSTFSYKLNPSLRQLHEQAAFVLFGGMLFTTIWLRFVALKDAYTNQVFKFFCASLVLGVLNFLGVLHVLFVIEVAGGIAFAILLTHGLRSLTTPR